MSLGKLAIRAMSEVFASSISADKKVVASVAKQFKTSASFGKITKVLNSATVSKGNVKITGEELKSLPECFKPLLEGTKNPVANISYKTGSKYNVAAIKLIDGDQVLATGAMSVVKPGSADGIVKARLNISDSIQANGYLDGHVSTWDGRFSRYSFGSDGYGAKFEFLRPNIGAQMKIKWGETWDKFYKNFYNDDYKSVMNKIHKNSYLLEQEGDSLVQNVKKFLRSSRLGETQQ